MASEEPDGPARIAAIKSRPDGRAVITTSDDETLIVHAEALHITGLREGDVLDTRARERLDLERSRQTAHEGALRLLTRRPRSEREIRQRLRQRELPADVVEQEVERLRESGLLDDEAFAQAWVGERQTKTPRGQRLLRSELLGHGVRSEIADEAVLSVDDRTAALAVARGRAHRLEGLEFRVFSQRLGGFLRRRGFAYDDIQEAVRTVWNENAPESERR